MKRALAFFSGGAGLAFAIGIMLMAWSAYVDHRALDRQFVKQTVAALQDWPAVVDSLQHINDSLLTIVASKVSGAKVERQRQHSILTEHPVATAPTSCAPWLDAFASCRREADSLRSAVDTLLAIHERDSVALDSSKALSRRAVGAIRIARNQCLLGLPCPVTFAELEYGPVDRHIGGSVGVELQGERIRPAVSVGADGDVRVHLRVLF